MPLIDKIILSFFLLSIPLGLGLKNFNNYLEDKAKKNSIDILYSDFKTNYFIDVKDISKSYENISIIRKNESVKMGSISSCLTVANFNRNELITYNEYVYKDKNLTNNLSKEYKQIIDWCNEYSEYKSTNDPDFFFYNYYLAQGLLNLYGIDKEVSVEAALYFFLKARTKKNTEEINLYISIVSLVNNSYQNFNDLSKLIIINEYISKI